MRPEKSEALFSFYTSLLDWRGRGDLYDVIEWLRSEKQFEKADRLRTIAGRLARELPEVGDPQAIRSIARSWK